MRCKCTNKLVNNRYPPLKYVNETHLFAGSSMKHFDKVLLENRIKSTKSSIGLKFAKYEALS